MSSATGTHRKNLVINLAQLEASTLQSLQEDSAIMETFLPGPSPRRPERPEPSKRQSKKEASVRKEMVVVKQDFGLVEERASPDPAGSIQDESEEEAAPLVGFRLRGQRKSIQHYNPTNHMVKTRIEAARDIRAAEDNYHRNTAVSPLPKTNKEPRRSSARTHEQRFFARVQGTMGLSCLQTIQQAYRDREKSERHAAKAEYVKELKKRREMAKERVQLQMDQKRYKALQERGEDKQKIIDHLGKQEVQREVELHRAHARYQHSSHLNRRRRKELTFLSDFATQNTSVSNALLRHDRQSRREDKEQESVARIHKQRTNLHEQQHMVNKYLEHRQLMRQTESAMMRAAVNAKMLQDANDRLMQAKSHVAQQKALSEQVGVFYPVPQLSSSSIPLGAPAPTERNGTTSPSSQSLTLRKYNTGLTMAKEHQQLRGIPA